MHWVFKKLEKLHLGPKLGHFWVKNVTLKIFLKKTIFSLSFLQYCNFKQKLIIDQILIKPQHKFPKKVI